MQRKLPLFIMALSSLFLPACESDEEAQPLKEIIILSITPGVIVVGGNSLNSAMIGDTITISGQHFSSVSSENLVSMASTPAEVISSSEKMIRAKVPYGIPFSYVDVEVARKGYVKAVSKISVKSTPPPTITNISPTSGPIGTMVTIYGRNLLETLESKMMRFSNANSTNATSVLIPFNPVKATSDSIMVKIPLEAKTGKITFYVRPAQDINNSFVSIMTPEVFTVTP